MRLNIRNISLIVIVILVYLIVSSLLGFYSAIHPDRIRSSDTPEHYQVKYDKISFLTKDNVRIHGWFIPSEYPTTKTIILLHGYPVDKGDLLPSRIKLHRKFNLLFIDFRGLGESDGFFTTFGKLEVLDVLGAVNYLNQHDIHTIGVWGLSMGGAVALLAAEQTPEIKALVVESSYARLDMMLDTYYRIPIFKYPLAMLTRLWGFIFLGYDVKEVSPVDAAAKLQIPILLIHSRSEELVPFEHARLLQKALQKNPKAQFLFYDVAGHGQISPQTVDVISLFFEKNL